MYPFENDRNRRRNPFDFFGMDDEFEKMFKKMEEMWEKAFEDFSFENLEPGKSFIHGYNINIGPDGRPRIQEFGHKPQKISDGKQIITDEREPLTDIIEGNEDVSVTLEVPGVEKKDIDLNLTETNLEITVNHPIRKYHKLIDLPCDVIPEKSKATYNNGILDINIKRKEKKNDTNDYHVNIE